MRTDHILGLGRTAFHRIAYTDWGAPDNPHVVICAHGLTRTGRDFDALARALAPHCRVLCPDLPGRGASDWLADPSEYAYPRYLADCTALIARAGARAGAALRLDWIGTSMGGLIGMMLASAAGTPVRRLVMNDIGPELAKEGLTRIGTYAGADPLFDSFDAGVAQLRELLRAWGPLDDQQWLELARHTLRQRADGRYGLHYDPAIAAALRDKVFDEDVDMWATWERVACPVLILRGRDSDLLRAGAARRMCERAAPTELIEYDGIGHAPSLLVPAQIEPIVRFLTAD
jgi:pimeloyl-ACP methyl ester carboxylesterase